ncbi:hypothetical protein V6615_04100 [Oscillospiraceae bacterium PP1C4]
MEQETIKVVRQAELAAEQTEKNAARECEAILTEAKANAVKTTSRMTADAKSHAALIVEQARKAGEVLQQEALEAVKGEIASLHDRAAANGTEVKRRILSELI